MTQAQLLLNDLKVPSSPIFILPSLKFWFKTIFLQLSSNTESKNFSKVNRGRVANLQQSKNTHHCLHIFLAVALPALQMATLWISRDSGCDKGHRMEHQHMKQHNGNFCYFWFVSGVPATQRALQTTHLT